MYFVILCLLVLLAVVCYLLGKSLSFSSYQSTHPLPKTLCILHNHRATFKCLTLFRVPPSPGSRSSPTLFFIPGAGGSAEQYYLQLLPFQHTDRIFLEHPGHGTNAGPPVPPTTALSPSSLISHLRGALTHFATSKQNIIIVAHSYGCALVPPLLACLPPRFPITHILLISPPSPTPPTPSFFLTLLLHLPAPLLSLLRCYHRAGGPRSASVARMLHSSASPALRELQLMWNARTPSAVVKSLMRQLRTTCTSEYASAISERGCRVRVVVGRDDRVASVAAAREVAAACKTSATVVDDCGHQVMLEKPEAVNTILRSFLDGE